MSQELWDGRYRIERTLGEGGMGQVVMARDMAQGERYVAIKLLSPEHRDHTTDFMREYSVQRCLNHPSIPLVHAFGFGEQRGREVPYFVMDFVRGVPLSTAIGSLTDPKPAWSWIVQVLRGLDHSHRAGYLHRDLKPGNIIVAPDSADEEASASLVDFGIAIPFTETPEELFIGTPEYSSPELMAGAPFDARQDLYAIGLLLYEILTGRRPWSGDDPTDLYHKRMYSAYQAIQSPHCSPRLTRLIADLLDARIDRRPPTAAVVIERLCDAVSQPTLVETPPAFYRRLLAQPFEKATELKAASEAWLGRAKPFRPILLIENPPGFDGPAICHQLTDEAAVGGARILRYALERRRHRPLEAIKPALDVLRALRAARSGEAASRFVPTGDDTMRDLANAATLMSRLDGPTVIAIDHLEWADAPSIELIIAVLTGARNPGLRVVATCDPTVPSHAKAALDRLRSMDVVAVVRRKALSLEAVTDWVDAALGEEAIPDAGILNLHERSGGRPERVRVLLAEEMRRGTLARTAAGFTWHGSLVVEEGGVRLAARSREALMSLAAEIDVALPESAVSIYLDTAVDGLMELVQSGLLVLDRPGWYAGHEDVRAWVSAGQTGGAKEAREWLARSVELAIPFPGQAERAAREWLRAARPLRAAPCLLAAAQDALASGLRLHGDGGARAGQLLEKAEWVLERSRPQIADPAELQALESLQREVGRVSIRLARARGQHEDWAKAALKLFERGMESGHAPTIEVALEAQLQLAMDKAQKADVKRLLDTGRALGLPAGLALEAWAGSWLEAREGRTDAALKRLGAVAREALDARRQLMLALAEADLALDAGRLEAGERALTQAWTAAERARDDRGLQLVMLQRVRATRLEQRPGRALELGRELGRRLGDRRAYRLEGRLSLELARVELMLGRPSAALAACARAAVFVVRDGDEDGVILERVVRAEAQAMAGDVEAAFVVLKRCMGPELADYARGLRREVELAVVGIAIHHRLRLPGIDPVRAAAERDRATRTARDLAEAAEAEGFRELALRALVLAAEGAVGGEASQAAEALAILSAIDDRVNRWGELGAPRFRIWHLLAEAHGLAGSPAEVDRFRQLAHTGMSRAAALLTRAEDRRAWLDARTQREVSAHAG